jgi:hypothetical protein
MKDFVIEKFNSGVMIIVLCLTVIIVFGLVTYACIDYNANQYKAQSACIANGGSWIPVSTGPALCIHGIVKQ